MSLNEDPKTTGMTEAQRAAYDRSEAALREFGQKHKALIHAQMELEAAETELHEAERALAVELGIAVRRAQRLP